MSQDIIGKEKTGNKSASKGMRIRDVKAGKGRERIRRESLRSGGAYGVLAGLFLGCYSYWVTRRKQRTVFSTRFLFFLLLLPGQLSHSLSLSIKFSGFSWHGTRVLCLWGTVVIAIIDITKETEKKDKDISGCLQENQRVILD